MTTKADIVAEISRRRFELNLGLLRVYNYYRVLVGLSLIAVASQTLFKSHLGELAPATFLWVGIGYTFINLLTAALVQTLPSRYLEGSLPGVALVLFDITALTWLMQLSGGVGSGLGALILVAVAAGAIVVRGRYSTLLAALATLLVLYEELYLSLRLPGQQDFFQAGILGILYFASSLTIQSLSRRLRQNDIRALTQAVELADLERINQQIVQRMRTGIVLVDQDNRVRMANQSARALLGLVQEEEALELLPEALEVRLDAWRADTELRTPPFQAGSSTPEIRVNFSAVRADDPDGDVTVFLEDTGEVQQQAQHLKLASLGRLSASIAHEIRNPLGAISHAAQLLKESEHLDKGDARLTDIIHSHCQRMNGVVENVLEMSRRSPPRPVRLALADLVEEFRIGFEESTPDVEVEVHIDPLDTEIRTDTSQMTQVLTNLAQNAARYSEAQSGRRYVQLEGGLDQATERPYLNVVDIGPGVPEAQWANLFEPFYTTDRKGTGLGLYISRELCETNQARLTYVPIEQGACFRITFPHPDRIPL